MEPVTVGEFRSRPHRSHPARGAEAPDLMRVGCGRELVLAADRILELLDAGIDELDDAAAPRADEMVVVLAFAEPLVAVLLLVQADASDEAALVQ